MRIIDYTKIPLGCLPSKMDARNYSLAKIGVQPLGAFPAEYPGGKTPDAWKHFVPPNAPYNQGTTGMCVAYSGCAGKSISEYRERKAWEDYAAGQLYGWREPSHYHGEGMYIEEAAQCLRLRGVASMANFPYMGSFMDLYAKAQPQDVRDRLQRIGMPQKIESYAFPKTVEEIKTAIMLWGWVWVSMPVYDSFYQGGHLGRISGNYRGGHAVVCIGWYTDPVLGFRWVYLNSWGKDWGPLKGFFTTPVDYPVNQVVAVTDRKPIDKSIYLKVGRASYIWGDKEYPLDVAPQLLDIPGKPGYARTMVPLRAISEITGYAVDWRDETKEIILTPPT